LKSSREVLCFDIASGGLSAARFTERLENSAYEEVPWKMPLSASSVTQAFRRLEHSISGDAPAAISISSFMHSFVVLDSDGNSKTSLYTWMDGASPDGLDAIRSVMGSEFHPRTGCHYHPMFPVFKLASEALRKRGPADRIVSPKTLLVESLTGEWVEDFGMAAASGLLNVRTANWDSDILRAANLSASHLPNLMERDAVVGQTSAGSVVVNGSGDGFLANIGSGCESSNRIAITLGTSAAVRQMVQAPALDPSAGTFCYRATSGNAFLLGCASSNGGNALDWARQEFGTPAAGFIPNREIPVFLPWLNGERSLEWKSELRPSWHGRRPDHTPAELQHSVMEGVLFNLAQYVEVIEKNSGVRASQIVLSGNGFMDPAVAPVLSALVSRDTLQPASSGLGTLRGAAVCAWRALGYDATPAIERLLNDAAFVAPVRVPGLEERFARFKQLRKLKSEEI
jgi:sugar (pentulose or hexulose) kinase